MIASSELLSAAVVQSLTAIVLLVCFRVAPFLGFAFANTRGTWPWRIASLAGLLTLAALLVELGDDGVRALLALALLYAYFASLALCLPALARAVLAGWVARLPLAVGLGFLYVIVPVATSPAFAALPALVLGWDSWLKAFSCCVDGASDPRVPGPARGATVFFMLVSPTLVWAERGQHLGSRALWRFGAQRCALALCTFAAQDAVRFLSLASATALVPAPAVSALQGIAYYLGHSGLASLQIGCMAVLGYRLPERYVHPLLATSPLDFWRRWNTWVGSWARRYLFMPLSTHARRTLPALPGFLAQGAAALVTFAVIGVLHDAPRIARPLNELGAAAPSLAATAMFTAFGVLVVAWAGVERLLRKRRATAAPESRLQRWLSWALFMPCLVLMSQLAQAVLS